MTVKKFVEIADYVETFYIRSNDTPFRVIDVFSAKISEEVMKRALYRGYQVKRFLPSAYDEDTDKFIIHIYI